jgi:hypothetical protein
MLIFNLPNLLFQSKGFLRNSEKFPLPLSLLFLRVHQYFKAEQGFGQWKADVTDFYA